MGTRVVLATVIYASVATSIVGCDAGKTAGHATTPISDSRDYGESVFRLQNAVLDALINATESGSPPSPLKAAALLADEDRVVRSCRDLNEAASISATGHEPRLSLKLRVFHSLAGCEFAARAVRTELESSSAANMESSR